MYERFTDRARKVMQLANQEAQRFNHACIGTEHVLLGLIKEGWGVGAQVLKRLGIDLSKTRIEIERLMPQGTGITDGKLPLTPRVKMLIQYATGEATAQGDTHIDTQHLLLGLLRETEGLGFQALVRLRASPSELRKEVFEATGRADKSVEPDLPELRELNFAIERLHHETSTAVARCDSEIERLEKEKARIIADWRKRNELPQP